MGNFWEEKRRKSAPAGGPGADTKATMKPQDSGPRARKYQDPGTAIEALVRWDELSASDLAEIGSLVRRGMATLEEEERSLLELRFVDGHTLQEISTELAISLEQTKYRLKRASTSLRRVLLNELALEEA